MDMEAWGKSPVIRIAPEDWEGEEKYKLLTYAQNHPKKIFLLPAYADFSQDIETLFSKEDGDITEIFPSFALNLEFSLLVTVHFENGDVTVNDLAELLTEWLSKKEMGAYIIAPDYNTLIEIKMQLALLGLQIAIYEPLEIKAVHWEKKLETVKDKLEQEIPCIQGFCQTLGKELSGSFARKLVQNLSEVLVELVDYFNSSDRKVSLQICGEEKSDLVHFLGSFFSVSEYDTNVDADLYLVVLSTYPDNYNKDLLEEFVKKHPQNLLFLVYQSASESVVMNIPRSKLLAMWKKELIQIGFANDILIFAEGADIFEENYEDLIFSNYTIDSLMASKNYSGKEEYQMNLFLEKIFYQKTSLTGEDLLSRLGLWQLLKYCQEVRKTNVNLVELVKKMNLATVFLIDAEWKRLYANHENKVVQKELNFNETRLKFELAMQKYDALLGERSLKAAFYDIGLLIDETISIVQVQEENALKKLQQDDFLNEEIMEDIYVGRESNLVVALQELANEMGDETANAVEELKNKISIMLQRTRDDAASAIKSLMSVSESFEQRANIQFTYPAYNSQQISVLSIPNIVEEEDLLNIVLNNIDVFCSDVGDKSNFGQGATFEYYYLIGSFGVELRKALKSSLTKKINCWRQKIYEENTAYIKNFFHELRDIPQREIQYSKSVLETLQISIAKEKEADVHDFSILEKQRGQIQSFISIWQEIKS